MLSQTGSRTQVGQEVAQEVVQKVIQRSDILVPFPAFAFVNAERVEPAVFTESDPSVETLLYFKSCFLCTCAENGWRYFKA